MLGSSPSQPKSRPIIKAQVKPKQALKRGPNGPVTSGPNLTAKAPRANSLPRLNSCSQLATFSQT